MKDKINDCIELFANSEVKTLTLTLFAERMVRDKNSSWYSDPVFENLRDGICEIFIMHGFSKVLTNKSEEDYCHPSYAPGDDDYDDVYIPVAFEVSQNYPNPFNLSTNITFGLPKQGDCLVEILNILGQAIYREYLQNMAPGYHTIDLGQFSFENHSSGIYFYRIKYDNECISRKMLLLK